MKAISNNHLAKSSMLFLVLGAALSKELQTLKFGFLYLSIVLSLAIALKTWKQKGFKTPKVFSSESKNAE